MFDTKIGIEVEFSGINRSKAASVVAKFLGGTVEDVYDHYDTKKITAPDGRVWKIMSDSSVTPIKKQNGIIVPADSDYKVELVSPILTYREDIEALQELIRKLRRAGAIAPDTAGIHIHLDNTGHTAKSIRNFINIIASRNDLLYKALQIKPERMSYCKKMDAYMVQQMNRRKPKTLADIERIWYSGYSEDTNRKYHSSRYHFCNLHSFFTGNHTIELRGFNSADENGNLHAGKIRAYIILALALNHQALTQKSASSRKPQTDNEKFAMRTYLNRIGFI